MKKAISIILAAATLAFATSAMAATTTGTVSNRNSNTTFVASPSNYSTMPCFRPGDTVHFTFSDSGSDITEGKDITVITYKYNTTKSDSTVQYINQYTATGSGDAVDYVVRNIETGVYQLDIKVGTEALYTAYYKIGNVTATLIPSNGNTYAYIITNKGDGTYSVGFVGKVTIDAPNITLADIDSEPGFEISFDGGTTSIKRNFSDSAVAGFAEDEDFALKDTSAYQAGDAFTDTDLIPEVVDDKTYYNGIEETELYGGYSFVYGMTIYNVPSASAAEAIEVDAITDAE